MCPQSTTPDPPPPTAEEWRPITPYKEWEGVYSCSSLGRVRREAAAPGARAGHILKPTMGRTGYLRVLLCYQGQTRCFLIHRLVAETFIGPIGRRQVKHQNGNKTDNCRTNLGCVQQPSKISPQRRPARGDPAAYRRMLDRRDAYREAPAGSLPWEIESSAVEV